MSFTFYPQLDAMDCGPACLKMVAAHYGKQYSLQLLRERSYISREGVSLLGIAEAAQSIGLRALGVRLSWKKLLRESGAPFVAHWRQKHFVVVYRIKKDMVYVADPAHGKVRYTREEFMKNWASAELEGEKVGIALLLEPTPDFYQREDDEKSRNVFSVLHLYLKPYRKLIRQVFIGLFFASLVQLAIPFLTQAVVDIGINNQDLSFIYLVLLAQILLVVGRLSVDFIRGWILLHVGARVNIALISDFLTKLMKLPIRFFDSKMTGDLLQRIQDHKRIEHFLSSQTLMTVFSLFNIVVFGIVVAIYNYKILLLFLTGTFLYVVWILIFMRKRRQVDIRRFAQMSENQGTLIELLQGMQEIKLTRSEIQKRWRWENLQARLFQTSIRGLTINQYQSAGASLINELTNILITLFSATLVLKGSLSLGMMLAIQYIIGQLNAPVNQLIQFFRTAQDARISLERLQEVHENKNEESEGGGQVKHLPSRMDLLINQVSFQYEGPHSPFALKEINLRIPEHKTTAIVGTSGSGKTSLIKLLLGFYEPVEGEIVVGDLNLKNLNKELWRANVGVVMQDGYLFSESIAENIAPGVDRIDEERLLQAAESACIRSFIEQLPLGFQTKIGNNGIGLSQGQRQRILIARAIYKNPPVLFLDEATNALDAGNEKHILENLQTFLQNRTSVVVAHRLSTVKNADNIVVLEQGRLVEQGTHTELIGMKGYYYKLVKNQLELGV